MSDHDHETPPLPQKLLDAASAGCAESQFLINRRHLMGLTAGLFAWAHMPRNAQAAPGTEPRLLIVLMPGAVDGLHVAPPLGDTTYVSLRGALALDRSKLLALSLKNGSSSGFGLNPVMPNFQRLYSAGDAALVQAIAPPVRIGSHFEGQYSVQSGTDSGPRSLPDGWLNRLLQYLPQGHPVKMSSMHIGPTPLILSGSAPVLAWSPGVPETVDLQAPVQDLYNRTNAELANLFRRGLAVNSLATNNTAPIGSALSMVRRGFIGTARLMKDPNGPRIAVLNTDGWDTHAEQTTALNAKLADFDAGLNDFYTEVGQDAWKSTVVVCVTEMGRRIAINGTSGTDHGIGSVAFLAGGAVAGRQIFGNWPGLTDLDGGSLRATTDMRALFKGLLQDHLQVPRTLLDDKVFPNSKLVAPMKDLLKASAARVATAAQTSRTGASASASLASGNAPSVPRYESAIARFRRVNGAS